MVLKAKRIGNLYILQGSTFTSIVVVASSSLTDYDAINFWHMRLGYMKEKSLVVLSKIGLLYYQTTQKLEFCEHCCLFMLFPSSSIAWNYLHWQNLSSPLRVLVKMILNFKSRWRFVSSALKFDHD